MVRLIFINGRFLTQPITGVQRYALELIRHIDFQLDEKPFSTRIKLVCLTPRVSFVAPGWKNIEIKHIGLCKGNIWEQVDLPLYSKGQLLFSPANIGPWNYHNQVVTFHDASVFAFPHAYSLTFRVKYSFIMKHLSQKVRLIITDSNFSKQELARYLSIKPERFRVVYLSGEHLNHIQNDDKILEKYQLGRKSFLLLVASQSPHKNLSRVVQAMKLVNADIKLVLVGGNYKGVFRENALDLLSSKVQMLGYINDGELKSLYENALGFIFPSFYEGFGIPLLEAMHCGCPVLCANRSSLPEIAGAAALYFDPFDVNQIAATIERFLSETILQEQLREMGHRRCGEFSWSETANRTLEIFLSMEC